MPVSGAEMEERVKKAGLRLITTFRLPEAGWWENYYVPMLARVGKLKEIHGSDPACALVLGSFEKDLEMYRKYRRYYGYTFFVMQSP